MNYKKSKTANTPSKKMQKNSPLRTASNHTY